MIDQVFPQSKERDDRNYKQEVHNQQIWENLMSAVQDDGSEYSNDPKDSVCPHCGKSGEVCSNPTDIGRKWEQMKCREKSRLMK